MCETCGRELHHPLAPSRRKFILGAAAIGLAFVGAAEAKEKRKQKENEEEKKKKPPKPQNVLSPDAALERLREGNARYVRGLALRHDFRHEREALAGGQNPYAAILSCADSRIAPEYAFDSGRGDLFVCRVAGNFASDEMIASLEYSVAVLNAPLILVLGHESCGAVDAAIKSLKDNTTLPGQLPSLVAGVGPAVKAVLQQGGDTLGSATRQNVIDTVSKLLTAGPILSAAVEQKKLKVVGGIYRLKDGRVDMVA
ncbi:MAG: carbonic anhydrase [Alphaproteobacteria bacterium]|nr:MAG: carbonic anhydrase [Alphaproteobacteria bacterium]